MTRLLTPFLLLLALVTTPALAEPLKSVPATLDPTKAYVLVEYELQPNPLAGVPLSAKTLPLSAGLQLARYDAERGDVRGEGKAADNPVPGKALAFEQFRNRPLIKATRGRLFLLELEPDLWVVQGWGGTSFSLGSYAVRLDPGTITDLGVVSAYPDTPEGEGPVKAGDIAMAALLGPFAKRPKPVPARVVFRPRLAGDLPLPTGWPRDRVRAVEWTPDARFGNHMGGLVNRIEGVNHRARQAEAQSKAEPETPAS